jgi:hypothetical protein
MDDGVEGDDTCRNGSHAAAVLVAELHRACSNSCLCRPLKRGRIIPWIGATATSGALMGTAQLRNWGKPRVREVPISPTF